MVRYAKPSNDRVTLNNSSAFVRRAPFASGFASHTLPTTPHAVLPASRHAPTRRRSSVKFCKVVSSCPSRRRGRSQAGVTLTVVQRERERDYFGGIAEVGTFRAVPVAFAAETCRSSHSCVARNSTRFASTT